MVVYLSTITIGSDVYLHAIGQFTRYTLRGFQEPEIPQIRCLPNPLGPQTFFLNFFESIIMPDSFLFFGFKQFNFLQQIRVFATINSFFL